MQDALHGVYGAAGDLPAEHMAVMHRHALRFKHLIDERYQANVLTIKGRFLGSIERDAWQRAIEDLNAAGRTRLVVDLSKTDFMDSTGVGLIVEGAESLRSAGGDVRLAGMPIRVKNVIVMTRLLGRLFAEYPTVEAVLQSFIDPSAVPVASQPE